MGNYNSYQPQILGQEWVPIRDEDQTFSPVIDTVEVGHGFTLTSTRLLQDARFYLHDFPQGSGLGQVFLATVYPRGFEDLSGPIERLLIPCNSGGITGSGTIFGASFAQALFDPSDSDFVEIFAGGTGERLDAYFAVNSYANPLVGKRILGVNLLYALNTTNTIPDTVDLWITVANDANQAQRYGSLFAGTLPLTPAAFPKDVFRMRMGEIDHFWSTSLSPLSTPDRMPWTFTNLQRFEASSANRHPIRVATTATSTGYSVDFGYMALEVLYCEEQRSAVGGRSFGAAINLGSASRPYRPGANVIPMRTIAQASNPALTAGNYTVVVSSADLGVAEVTDIASRPQTISSSQYPALNAVRELYAIPAHPGVQVNFPTPIEDHVGDTLTQVVTHILPQISLHTSGGTMTEPHAYGRQIAAQVYGSNTATQEIYDDISGVAANYPQVRFYARRFGDTTVPLTLTGVAPLNTSTVSITAAEYDALTEIIDGWKEITLRFTTVPSMGTVAGNPGWTWSAPGENAGNRWEILGACAPAVSGIPGNLFNPVPTADRLGVATYQPPAGDTVELTWMPQGCGSPYVSGATADSAVDAFLIFSQDPPTVSGFTLTQLTQTVTGIGFDCGSLPCCIPSGIGYQRLTWSPWSLPASGFGGYELQRWDTTPGATFQTIMLASSPYTTGFNDYEARVGLNSVYRIRNLNVYNFAGAWSTQVTGSPPTPGVTGGCTDNTGALIFTSNAMQSGASNAAYVMQWEGFPDETFQLPEADDVIFQPMYGRDGRVAFHGTERGLETFDRTLLIQAAAIDPVRLADVKTLRDLAWNDLPYICVRDDIGDRWYANVRVPTTNARFNRTKYMARVSIVETTTTPFAVDP